MHNVIRVVLGSLAIALTAYYSGASFELALTIFGGARDGMSRSRLHGSARAHGRWG
jgi:hypothetical protein